MPGFKTLKEGQKVTFEITCRKQGRSRQATSKPPEYPSIEKPGCVARFFFHLTISRLADIGVVSVSVDTVPRRFRIATCPIRVPGFSHAGCTRAFRTPFSVTAAGCARIIAPPPEHSYAHAIQMGYFLSRRRQLR